MKFRSLDPSFLLSEVFEPKNETHSKRRTQGCPSAMLRLDRAHREFLQLEEMWAISGTNPCCFQLSGILKKGRSRVELAKTQQRKTDPTRAQLWIGMGKAKNGQRVRLHCHVLVELSHAVCANLP